MDTPTDIAKTNDMYRQSIGFVKMRNFEIVVTQGVVETFDSFDDVLTEIREFDNFTPDNDPFGEHDFGKIVVDGHKMYWKIDYFDLDRQFHSPDKYSVDLTFRVMTVMLREEY